MPTYRKHKPSGRAVVQWKPLFGDQPHYLRGKFGSPESLAEWASIQEQIAEAARLKADDTRKPSKPVTNIARMLTAYFLTIRDKIDQRDRKSIKYAIDIVAAKYGAFGVNEFTPVALEDCRDAMIEKGWSRKYINREVSRVRRAFKWAVVQGHAKAETFGALAMLEGLKKGWTSAPELKKVRPASWTTVARVLPFLSRQVADMVQLQWLAGMRSGELTSMRTDSVDRGSVPWEYKPVDHKKAWLEKDRIIYFGPKARKILKRYLHKTGFLFTPEGSIQERFTELRKNRKTPLYGKANKPPKVRRDLAESYTTSTYQRAIIYGFIRLGLSCGIKKRPAKGEAIEKWLAQKQIKYFFPHQLRHSRGTLTREKFGVEGARALLQNTFDATLIYAEDDAKLAKQIASRTG